MCELRRLSGHGAVSGPALCPCAVDAALVMIDCWALDERSLGACEPSETGDYAATAYVQFR